MANQLYIKENSDKKNIFPKNYTDNIRDKESNKTLTEILQGFNCYFLSYTGNVETTRLQVPKLLRKQGLWITYVDYENNTITEYYDNPSIEDSKFKDSSNWREGNNRLVGDLSISANGNWVIDNKETEFKAQGEAGITPLIRFSDNKFQVSYNEGKFWENITGNVTNQLKISRYIGADENLPTSGIAEGTIYMKGPFYEDDDALHEYPSYRMYIYAWKDNTLAWQDNGEFTSVIVGVVNDLTTGGADKALSAEMGKEIDFRTLTMMGVRNPNIKKDVEVLEEIDYSLIEHEGQIMNGKIVSAGANYYYTEPIALSKGDILVVYCNSTSPIWETDADGSYYRYLGHSQLAAYTSQYYKHIATKDCYVALSYYRNSDIIPTSGSSVIRIYKYISPTEAHIRKLIENNSDLIKGIGRKKVTSQVVANSRYAAILSDSKKVAVKITSAPEGRLIISVLDLTDKAVRLQDYAVVGKTYVFDIPVDHTSIIVQNFTGAEGTIEFEIIEGYIKEIYEELYSVSEDIDDLSKEVDDLSKEVDAINSLFTVVQSTNLFNSNDQDILLGKYINSEGSTSNNSSFNITGYIPVEGGKTYYFGNNGTASAFGRTLEFYDSSRKVIAGSFIGQGVYNVIAPSDAVYMRCSVNVSLWDGFQVNADELRTYEEWFEPYRLVNIEDGSITMDMLSDSVKAAIDVKSFNSFTAESELTQGEVLTLAAVHIGKNSVETAHVEGEFSKISIGVGYSTSEQYLNRGYASCWVEIDQTSIRQYRSYNNTEEYTLIDEKAHGLTLTNSTVIEINNQVENAKLRVCNDIGDSYEQNIQVGVGTPFIINEGANSITVKLSFMPQEINKSIWAFGDSYFNFTSDIRWPYYFEQNGYTNWLSNNQPGLSPTSALTDLENLLLLGARPKYVLWCLGMNGATTETTDSEGNYIINSAQKSVIDSVVNLCRGNNIELVLTTIPTVPTRQKTGFNNYVRSLGVKYIDFEKAVGTNSSGEWNEGLLSSDGVHPTAAGAKVLASRVLVDFPELTIV